MDIYDYLRLDHENIAHLFELFDSSSSDMRQKQLIAMIIQELIVHAESERDTFYKALQSHASTKEDAFHCKEEHKAIEDQINRIANSQNDNTFWLKEVQKLRTMVEQHVQEEESTIFNEARKVLSQSDAYILKEKMHYLKMQLIEHFNNSSVTDADNEIYVIKHQITKNNHPDSGV
ncbi:MAG: hemerythrin domain-containing protein [Tatlockia sp.]|jgi:hemerythrin superfamily protein